MPEGDTLYRTATRLREALVTQHIVHAQADNPHHPCDVTACRDQSVIAVEARGKHLLIHLQQGHVLHTHLGMTGSWHLYLAGAPWHKPARQAGVTLQTATSVAVCFHPKTLELLTPQQFRRHRWLSRLGPDILAPELDEPAIHSRLRAHPLRPIGEAIMDQTALCGVGNIYKSEVLFTCRVDPLLHVGKLSDAQLTKIIQTARHLMRRNVGPGPRRTRYRNDAHRCWVYRRMGQACLQCGTTIQMIRQGELGRSTYWCPMCQATPQPTE